MNKSPLFGLVRPKFPGRPWLAWAALGSARLILLLFASGLACSGADLPPSRSAFTVIAHRGNHTHAHENTVAALQRAIQAGVDYAEIDVRRTADGKYVLMHDASVERMTDGHGRVSELTFAYIRSLHVRDLKRPEIPPDRVPAFEEALAAIKGKMNLYLDFKSGDRTAVARAIREAGVARQILIYDEAESASEWHRVAPDLPLIVSPPANAKTPEQVIAFGQKTGIQVLDGEWQRYSRPIVEAAQRAGLKVWPDIQEDKETPDYFEKVLQLGFDGAQTDHPEELIAWLKKQKRR